MSVKELLSSIDSEELAEWYAYHQRWPIDNGWQQTARICRTICAASGNFKRVPDEKTFIPAALKERQSTHEMASELQKLVEARKGT